MLTKVTIWLAAACLVLIVQPSGAYEIKPCEGYSGKIMSAEVHNCPNKTAEYCEIGRGDTLSWDIKYTNGASYQRTGMSVMTGVTYGKFWSEFDQCRVQPGFCPGEEGQVRANHFEFKLRDFQGYIKTGLVAPLTLYTKYKPDYRGEYYIVCIELPAKFHEA